MLALLSREVSLVQFLEFSWFQALSYFSPAREDIKRKEGMVRKLKALTSNMLKLANRKKRWSIRWEMVKLVRLMC